MIKWIEELTEREQSWKTIKKQVKVTGTKSSTILSFLHNNFNDPNCISKGPVAVYLLLAITRVS